MGTKLYVDLDRDDVRRRLVGSICRYKGRPVYVRSNERDIIHIEDLETRERKIINHTDAEFDYRSPPLGYMNYDGRTFYLVRIPTRDNGRAGVSTDNVTTHEGAGLPVFHCKEMGECISGVHPNFEQAVKNVLEEGYDSCAFHRHLAFGRVGLGLGLYYRGRVVGLYEAGCIRLITSGESSFLERIIRKCGVRLA